MNKCIFNQTTGQILTFTVQEQDFLGMLNNWVDSDYIDIGDIPSKAETATLWVNPKTRTLEPRPE